MDYGQSPLKMNTLNLLFFVATSAQWYVIRKQESLQTCLIDENVGHIIVIIMYHWNIVVIIMYH